MLIMIVGVILLVAVIGFVVVRNIMKQIAQGSAPQPPVVVTAMTAGKQEWQPQLKAVGSLRALRGVDVTTEIAGLVREIRFKSGDEVKSGAVLVQLNADSDLAQLASLEAAADLAQTTLTRDRVQLAAQAISQAQIDGDEADLKSKRAQAAAQQAIIDKKTIRAPFSGRLGITLVNPGQYLNPGDKVVTLQTIDPIYIDFNLPQQQIGGVAVGQTVTVLSDAFRGQAFDGKVTAIDAKVDTTTRNVQIEATVANPKRLLLPGMFARAAVDSGEKQSYLTLPQTAITYNPYGATVFVTAEKKDAKGHAQLQAQQVFITPGPTRGDQVAILKGVSEGDTIVTSGQLKLKNGTPVRVDNSVQPLNDANPTPQEQ
ncbi:MAG TPA: efflux RND transporter periplasmic adaptor subunit [Steroidobacteraceae bacterium]|nr:efflux RND transporter periplasmic adaptor subunit [Steroidobacteraceae bacterium]